MNIGEIFSQATAWGANIWVQVLLVLIASFIASRIRHYLLNKIEAKLASTSQIWSMSIVEAIRRPAALLIWIAGVSFSIDIIRGAYETPIFESIPPLRIIAVIATLTWFAAKLILSYERRFVAQKVDSKPDFDRTTAEFVGKISRASAIFMGILIAMQSLGLNIAGILAFGGVGGIAIGFAAREMIANYFGAMMIFLDKPFKVGDTITSPDRDIEGTVLEIGWRQTVIERFDTRTLYVPNSAFASISVRNHTRQRNRRIFEYVGIRYDDSAQIEAIVSDINEMLRNNPEIDPTNSIMVNFDRFAASSLDIIIYCFTKATAWAEYLDAKQRVLVEVMNIVDKHGAEIAFPTTTIHVTEESAIQSLANKGE